MAVPNKWFFFLSHDTNYRIENIGVPIYTLQNKPGNLIGVDKQTEWTLINTEPNTVDVATLIKGVGYWMQTDITNLLSPVNIILDTHADLVGKLDFDMVSELNNLNNYDWFFCSNYTNISFQPGLSANNYEIYTRNVLGLFELVNSINEWGDMVNEDGAITTFKGGQPYWIYIKSKPAGVTYKTVLNSQSIVTNLVDTPTVDLGVIHVNIDINNPPDTSDEIEITTTSGKVKTSYFNLWVYLVQRGLITAPTSPPSITDSTINEIVRKYLIGTVTELEDVLTTYGTMKNWKLDKLTNIVELFNYDKS